MPVCGVGIVAEGLLGFMTHVVHGVEEESAGAARGIEHVVVCRRLEHLYRKLDDLAWCEILPEVTLEEVVKKLLKRNSLGIEISFIEVDRLQMRDAHLERAL